MINYTLKNQKSSNQVIIKFSKKSFEYIVTCYPKAWIIVLDAIKTELRKKYDTVLFDYEQREILDKLWIESSNQIPRQLTDHYFEKWIADGFRLLDNDTGSGLKMLNEIFLKYYNLQAN